MEKGKTWRWVMGLVYIFSVANIWIAASFVVQSVVYAGVSPFLVTYICNSLFVIYIPMVEVGRYLEDSYGSLLFWRNKKRSSLEELRESEQAILLGDGYLGVKANELNLSVIMEDGISSLNEKAVHSNLESVSNELERSLPVQADEDVNKGVDEKGRWTRARVAKSNTILSSVSSLFTFVVSLVFLGEKFTWVKLLSVLFCMAGTIIVSLGDSETGLSAVSSKPLLGDILALVSAGLYAVYITLIRLKLPDNDGKSGHASMAQFLGYLGLFNLIIFLPVALVLDLTNLEPFCKLTWKQFGLIVGKGLLDNVLSDYLWAKAVLLTTTTVATAGLSIQVPLAAIVDSLIGNAPRLMDGLGALAVLIGFVGINIPSDAFSRSKGASIELENENVRSTDQDRVSLPQTTVGIK
ncbi:PREDICTED: solute carrier family 35 member F5 isoform X2 [Populus euphratica]|uniref:Solute carrier family 35 member F5 isoform X2 n=1 Tax=Populus euphratica TaxID=75702 RepID=A0AAJ6THU6_POPEU|nr:PREDICTED: solute carrier family 35 member F5 isoform X2 [Populus euphratica]